MIHPGLTRERLRGDIVRLAHRGLSVAEYARLVGATLSRAVAAEGSCLMTVDPATMLPTAEFVENGLPAPTLLRMIDIELREPDYNKWVHLAPKCPAASLSDVTAGDLDRSLRQREIRRPGGFADELRVVLASGTGTWGQLTLFRAARRPFFVDDDVHLVSSVAGLVADGLRRAMLLGEARRGDGDIGMLVLDAADEVSMANPSAQRWLDALGTGERPRSRLPLVVPAVARQARALSRLAPGPTEARPARARVRTASGEWLIVRGSVLGSAPDAPVAVLIEEARQAEMAPLMADAYGFSTQERRVTELVAQGLSTKQIADRLHLSAYTVQDHLKSIFTKSGSASRGDLVARLFHDHFADALTSGETPDRT
ncbi:helix-turn-helix transcriptional regulator [Plantactinospora veratri]|uniref:Helix-turn-helix transcriptional regulator n=1 Tax=Plantactinospora veratri TaxID=1436122 RepID=A0ABU7SF45_9ACTN